MDVTSKYIGQYLSYDIQTVHDGIDMHGINTRARFDDLDRDFENVWNARPACFWVRLHLSVGYSVLAGFQAKCLSQIVNKSILTAPNYQYLWLLINDAHFSEYK